jgi:methionyl-tRNA formyltransferase
LKNGEIEHGVTLHEITPGIDDGPIVAQVKYSIYPQFDEVIEVFNRALEYAWTLFQQTMPNLDKIKARQQNNSEATYYDLGQNSLLGERRSFRKAESLELQTSKH